MTYIDNLENQSIFIIREAYRKFKKLAVLWSVGKDSTVLLWLIKKAFLGHCPVPIVHIDTAFKMPEMIVYRDKIAREWDLDLIVGRNEEALKEGMSPKKGVLQCCEKLKTEGLQKLVKRKGYKALILGIRRDEEGTRAKERYFSQRGGNFEWNFKDQPPEFWDQFNTEVTYNTHVRIHPLLHWRELNIWEYIEREKMPLIDLYFAKGGRRYRSIGCYPCTESFPSEADTIDKIIEELKTLTSSERSKRSQDKVSPFAMEKLRARGYM